MTDPKRWSSPGSEVDPVLQSVFRYAQGLAPTAGETQSLLRRVEAAARSASEPPFARRAVAGSRWGRAKAVVLAAALGAALGSVAFAGYAVHELSVEAAASRAKVQASARPQRKIADLPRSAVANPPSAELAELPETPALKTPQPSSERAALRAPSAQPVAAAPEASLQSEAELLQAARALVGSAPAEALARTRAHTARFPNSALTEERSALEIEALQRLGRTAEAESAFARFEAQHPRSPYRRRLRALLP